MYTYEDLVGDWKGFEFKLVEPSDYKNVLEHLRANFYRSELLCQLMSYSEETAINLDETILEHLRHHFSFLVLEKKSGKIAGVRVMYESTQDEYSSSPVCVKKRGCWTGDNIRHHFLTELEDKCNIFQLYAISHCAQIHLTSVALEFLSQGLEMEIYGRGNAFLRKNGFMMAKGCFSAEHFKIANGFGFKELARLYTKDYRNEEGVQVFPSSENDHFVALMATKL